MKIIIETGDSISDIAALKLPSSVKTRNANVRKVELMGMCTLASDLEVLRKFGATGKLKAFRYNGWEVTKNAGHNSKLFTGGEEFEVNI